MRSKHHFDKPFQLYHLSDHNMDRQILTPRPMDPDCVMEGEDWKTPRICVAPSIDGCVSAIVDSILDPYGMKFWVHVPINLIDLFNNHDVYCPSVRQVPDAEATGEHWLKAPTRFKTIGQIEVLDVDENVQMNFKWGDEISTMYRYNWRWIIRDACNNDIDMHI